MSCCMCDCLWWMKRFVIFFDISCFSLCSHRTLVMKQFSGLPCMISVFMPTSVIITETTFEVAYSIDFASLGNKSTPNTQPSWVFICLSNTAFIPSWLITILLWSSLLRTPHFDRTNVMENRFILVCLLYLTDSNV